MIGPIVALSLGALCGLLQVLGAPWWLQIGTGVPCLILLPGWAIARGLWPRSSLIQSLVDASWCGILVMVAGVTLLRLTGLGPGLLWAFSAAVFLLATVRTHTHWAVPLPSARAAFGLFVLLATVGLLGASHSPTLSRGLDVGWYHKEIQDSLQGQVTLEAANGWSSENWVNSPTEGALVLVDDPTPGGSLEIAQSGSIGVLLRGPIGARFTLSQGASRSVSNPIAADVEEEEEEGPVARYLDRGMTGLLLDVSPGSLEIEVENSNGDHQVYILPGQEAIWSLDRSGEAKILHYYQLLNKVENQRWALEVLDSRHLTINQPPLWSYVLAVPAALGDGEMRGANLLFLFVLVLVGLSGLALLESMAPGAAWGAWALPGLYVGVHFHMMVVPGSTNFPDSLYTAALLGGLGALTQLRRDRSASRFALLGTAAGLLRYPGTVVLGTAALLHWAILKKGAGNALRSLAIAVGITASLIGIAGILSGQFGEWLSILWFETGPEHWDNNKEASPLLHRPLEFYTEWARYQGFGRLGGLAIAAWALLTGALLIACSKARWILGLALSYSLVLCTIDHFPSHYFLPLVAMMGLAMAVVTERPQRSETREAIGAAMAIIPLSLLLSGGVG